MTNDQWSGQRAWILEFVGRLFMDYEGNLTTQDKPNAALTDTVRRVAAYPLLDALRERRSRRFARGMTLPAGPLAYQSERPPQPLTEDEEALLAFAACGITGPVMADLCYTAEGGGGIMAGFVGRTVSSGDALQTVALIGMNDEGAWF